MHPSPAKNAIGGLIGAVVALLGILLGNAVARMTSSEHAAAPGAAVHEQQH
jgi:hypothetical protein